MKFVAALMTATLLGGCANLSESRLGYCPAASAARSENPSNDANSATLDVLTYNIEGLPWPARTARSSDLRRISAILRQMHDTGTAPDLILFQEAFSTAAVRSVQNAGYEALASGPSRTQPSSARSDGKLPGRARPRKGELGIRLMTSGLAIASRYPIIARVAEPYGRKSCAGFDCLANKGVVLASVVVPGVPQPVDIVNTHMNSAKASRVAPARQLAAHQRQSHELEAFLSRHHDPQRPLIIGGDFNMRRAPDRFDLFGPRQALALVHQWCLERRSCDVRQSWDGDEPWLDTQDLQFFSPGDGVEVEPIRVDAMFDGRPSSPKLSDHDGLRVTYRLSWPASARSAQFSICDTDQKPKIRQ